MTPDAQSTVHDFIVAHYNLEEFKTLCFELGVPYDDLTGRGLSGQARELILLLERQDRFGDLLTILQETHPEPFARASFGKDPTVKDRAPYAAGSAPTGTGSLLLYYYENPPYNSIEMHYIGEETIKDVRVWKNFTDKAGKEHRVQVEQFFPEQDLRMIWHHVPVKVMRKNDVVRFHLIGENSTLDKKAIVEVVFTDARTSETLTKKQEFELKR